MLPFQFKYSHNSSDKLYMRDFLLSIVYNNSINMSKDIITKLIVDRYIILLKVL